MKYTYYAFDFDNHHAWRLTMSAGFWRSRDNGALVSIGLVVGEDCSYMEMRKWEYQGKAIPVDYCANIGGAW